tara:strand:+ start:483 stop:815 length:333 start_codon:yes stop_codon:yes gene_type:complete
MNARELISQHIGDQVLSTSNHDGMGVARATDAILAAMPDIIRAMVVPLVFIRHPIGWNCTGFMIDTRGSCGGVYVMRGLYGKPRFDSLEDAITACNAHNAAQIMTGLGIG